MKNEVKIALIGFMSIYTFMGCTNPNTRPNVITSNPNKAPITINQLSSVTKCNTITDVLGQPNQVNGNILYYNISDNQLKNDAVIEINNYYRSSFTLNAEIKKLSFKEDDILREKYYYYLDKINEAKCDSGKYCFEMPIGNSRSAVEYAEKKTQECNDKELKQKDIIEKYEDKMLDLKEELIKTRKALPIWYQYKI